MAIADADLKAIATAIAKADGHPMPEVYGDRVLAASKNQSMPEYPVSEPEA